MNVDILNAAAKAALASRRAAVEEHIKRMHVDGAQASSVTGSSSSPPIGAAGHASAPMQFGYSVNNVHVVAPAYSPQGVQPFNYVMAPQGVYNSSITRNHFGAIVQGTSPRVAPTASWYSPSLKQPARTSPRKQPDGVTVARDTVTSAAKRKDTLQASLPPGVTAMGPARDFVADGQRGEMQAEGAHRTQVLHSSAEAEVGQGQQGERPAVVLEEGATVFSAADVRAIRRHITDLQARVRREKDGKQEASSEAKAARTAAAAERIALEAKDAELRVARAKVMELSTLVRQISARALHSDPLTPREMHHVALAVQAAQPEALHSAMQAAARGTIAAATQAAAASLAQSERRSPSPNKGRTDAYVFALAQKLAPASSPTGKVSARAASRSPGGPARHLLAPEVEQGIAASLPSLQATSPALAALLASSLTGEPLSEKDRAHAVTDILALIDATEAKWRSSSTIVESYHAGRVAAAQAAAPADTSVERAQQHETMRADAGISSSSNMVSAQAPDSEASPSSAMPKAASVPVSAAEVPLSQQHQDIPALRDAREGKSGRERPAEPAALPSRRDTSPLPPSTAGVRPSAGEVRALAPVASRQGRATGGSSPFEKVRVKEPTALQESSRDDLASLPVSLPVVVPPPPVPVPPPSAPAPGEQRVRARSPGKEDRNISPLKTYASKAAVPAERSGASKPAASPVSAADSRTSSPPSSAKQSSASPAPQSEVRAEQKPAPALDETVASLEQQPKKDLSSKIAPIDSKRSLPSSLADVTVAPAAIEQAQAGLVVAPAPAAAPSPAVAEPVLSASAQVTSPAPASAPAPDAATVALPAPAPAPVPSTEVASVEAEAQPRSEPVPVPQPGVEAAPALVTAAVREDSSPSAPEQMLSVPTETVSEVSTEPVSDQAPEAPSAAHPQSETEITSVATSDSTTGEAAVAANVSVQAPAEAAPEHVEEPSSADVAPPAPPAPPAKIALPPKLPVKSGADAPVALPGKLPGLKIPSASKPLPNPEPAPAAAASAPSYKTKLAARAAEEAAKKAAEEQAKLKADEERKAAKKAEVMAKLGKSKDTGSVGSVSSLPSPVPPGEQEAEEAKAPQPPGPPKLPPKPSPPTVPPKPAPPSPVASPSSAGPATGGPAPPPKPPVKPAPPKPASISTSGPPSEAGSRASTPTHQSQVDASSDAVPSPPGSRRPSAPPPPPPPGKDVVTAPSAPKVPPKPAPKGSAPNEAPAPEQTVESGPGLRAPPKPPVKAPPKPTETVPSTSAAPPPPPVATVEAAHTTADSKPQAPTPPPRRDSAPPPPSKASNPDEEHAGSGVPATPPSPGGQPDSRAAPAPPSRKGPPPKPAPAAASPDPASTVTVPASSKPAGPKPAGPPPPRKPTAAGAGEGSPSAGPPRPSTPTGSRPASPKGSRPSSPTPSKPAEDASTVSEAGSAAAPPPPKAAPGAGRSAPPPPRKAADAPAEAPASPSAGDSSKPSKPAGPPPPSAKRGSGAPPPPKKGTPAPSAEADV